MRVYSAADEEIIRDRELVSEWAGSGFLDSTQKSALLGDLKTDLRQTNGFLRSVLFFFSALIVIAGVGLVAASSPTHSDSELAGLCVVSGLVCAFLAELACRNRLYRFGVEEALGVSAVVLFGVGLALVFETSGWAGIAGLLVGALGAIVLYLRFGFFYAAIGSVVCAAAIPFQLSVGADLKRLLSTIVLAGVLVIVRRIRLSRRELPAGSAAEAVEAVAWFGMYVVVNVQLIPPAFLSPPGLFNQSAQASDIHSGTPFFFLTWAAVWILPAAGLWLGLRRKDRLVILANLAAALLTLSTNKRYLGWPMHSWDPMLFGIFLMTSAILLRRWLQRGPNGARHGFTAVRILRNDERVMAAVSIAGSVVHPHVASRGTVEPKQVGLQEGGGQSGGGGASGEF